MTGGLDLAAEWAGFTTVGQCEWADYPTKVLEKHWPKADTWRDVRDVTAKSIQDRGIKEKITVLSGGFPCQPHSLAGKRMASTDERDLWPEYKRIIDEIKPKWVVAENVPGLLSSENGRFFGGILRDLADMGYDVGWCCFPAYLTGAIFKGERVFIVATTASKRWGNLAKNKQDRLSRLIIQTRNEWSRKEINSLLGLQRLLPKPVSGILRNDDGLSEGMDRIKCLGNAVNPYQAYPIFQAIADIESEATQ